MFVLQLKNFSALGRLAADLHIMMLRPNKSKVPFVNHDCFITVLPEESMLHHVR
jgi:hypothetical protein